MQYVYVLLLVNLILNGNFSQGLDHWIAGTGWGAEKKEAVVLLDNRAGNATLSSLLCSEPVEVDQQDIVRGQATIWESRPNSGYTVPGIRWYDANGARMTDYFWGYDNRVRKQWVQVTFETDVPENAASMSFCFVGAAYAGKTYRASADNVFLQYVK